MPPCRLHLPAPNPFVPTDFALHTNEAGEAGAAPTVAVDIPGRMCIYHKVSRRLGPPCLCSILGAVIDLGFECQTSK